MLCPVWQPVHMQGMGATLDGSLAAYLLLLAVVFYFSDWAFTVPGFTTAVSFQRLGAALSAKRNKWEIFRALA